MPNLTMKIYKNMPKNMPNKVASNGQPSPRPTLSQNFRMRQTLPIPTLSSTFRTRSLRRPTSRFQTPPTQFRSPSLSFSRSIARVRAASAGATWPIPGAHSCGKTQRSTSTWTGGRLAKRFLRRIATKSRPSLRDFTVVFVKKIERAIRSASEGLEGDARRGGNTARM